MTTTYDKLVKYFNSHFDNKAPDVSKLSRAERMAYGPWLSRPMTFTKVAREDGEYFIVTYSLGLFKSKDIEAVLKKFGLTKIKSVSGTRSSDPSYYAKMPEVKSK